MLKNFIFFILLFPLLKLHSQTVVSGNVYNENQVALSGVLVVNINNDDQTLTDQNGYFLINANSGNELRFIRQNYERVSSIVNPNSIFFGLNITMVFAPTDIEEVKVSPKLSGNLAKDSKSLTKFDKLAQLNNDIGLPLPKGKMRETAPPQIKDVGVFGFLASNINVFTLYKNISGDARRMRSLYKYNDFQEKIERLKTNLRPDFFKENNVKDSQIADFLSFALLKSNDLNNSFKTKNSDKAEFILLEIVPEYLKRGK